MDILTTLANIASILTAIVAAYAYVAYKRDLAKKRRKLETYLKREKAAGTDKGQRSVLHLMARLGLTEAEVFQASFRSRCIQRRIATNPANNRAEAILLEYNSAGHP